MRSAVLGAIVAAGLLGACGGDGGEDGGPPLRSVVEAACEQAESCGYFENPGAPRTVAECVDALTACLAAESAAARDAWREEMGDCNQLSTCDGFDACYHETPTRC